MFAEEQPHLRSLPLEPFRYYQYGTRIVHLDGSVEVAEAQLAGTRKDYVAAVTTVPLLIIDDLGMRTLPHTAAEDLLEIVIRRYERASTLLTSNRPVEDWGQAPRRHRGRHRDARPSAPPRPRAHLWAAQLAHAPPQRARRRRSVTTSMTQRALPSERPDLDGGRYPSTPKTRLALSSRTALQHPRLERPLLWPGFRRLPFGRV